VRPLDGPLDRIRLRDGWQGGYVFPTSKDGPTKADNFRNRVLAVAVKRANERLADDNLPPLPAKLTPHSMRRTSASVLYALGEDPGVVMDEMGHTDPGLALRVYRRSMRRDESEKAALRRLVEGSVLAASGSTSENGSVRTPDRTRRSPIESGTKGP
jgi:integrase